MVARVALIGVGMVASTHAAAIAASDKLVLHGVLSRRPERAQAFCDTYVESHGAPAPVCYSDLEALAADEMMDFVIICTPPDSRSDIVEALCNVNKPILMEKPIERTLEQAAAIVEQCERADVPLGVVFQHRMREASQHLKTLMVDGKFGAIGVVEIAVPWWRPQSYYDEVGRGTYARDGGGVLISQAIHTLDLALSLCGPVNRVQAMARTSRLHRMEAEDFVCAGLDFANGACGSLVASTASFPGTAESILFHFENASVRLQSGLVDINWRNGENQQFGEAATTGGARIRWHLPMPGIRQSSRISPKP
nr:Gfo/Idh/MocA family oxidoreductase [Marinicella sp. W31]MDC2875911.1 Gfo/Idh/MocA family oxidoreductase [Marinicella sp. W31]